MLSAKIFEDISIKSSEAANSRPAKLELATREVRLIYTQVFICIRQMLFAPEARVAGLETRRDPAAK